MKPSRSLDHLLSLVVRHIDPEHIHAVDDRYRKVLKFESISRLLIRNDTAIMLSPETYARFIRPHDARLLKEVGAGSIHFCGNGRHLIPPLLEIPDLRGLDFGQPEMMDIAARYRICRERHIVLTHLRPSREDLISGRAKRNFPTGVVFVYEARDFSDAREVVRAYYAP